MMNGIYILKTADGYRVAYSEKYYDLVDFVGQSGEDDPFFHINGKIAKEIFDNSVRFDTYEQVLHVAKYIASQHGETDDGIHLITCAAHFNYGDLTNGTNS